MQPTYSIKPFWSDGKRSLYHGDAYKLCEFFGVNSFQAIVTDPPYGEGLLADGDESPKQSAKLLGDVLDAAHHTVRPGGHVAFFWANRSVNLAIRAAEKAGLEFKRLLTMHLRQSNARPYKGWLLKTQPIVVMRMPGREMPAWRQGAAAAILDAMRVQGVSAKKLAESLSVSPRLIYKWTRADDEAWSYPKAEHRGKILEILGVRVPPPQKDDNVSYRDDLYIVDGGHADTNHPCEKPLWVVEDIVRRLGGPVLDPFCGSGTTLAAARRVGVQGVGFEIREAHCVQAEERLRQKELFDVDPRHK